MSTTATKEPRAASGAAKVPARRRDDDGRAEKPDALIQGLGWFSIALGAAELLAPEMVADLVGIRKKNLTMIRLFGLREMAGGIGLLAGSNATPWLWARVAGDAMDLAFLGASGKGRPARFISSAAAVAGVAALDVYGSRRASETEGSHALPIEVRKTVTIYRPPAELYAFWRKLENLPRFMEHLESVRVLDERRSAWTAKGPVGSQYEWQAEITEDRPGELISWRSVPPSDGFNTGTVTFLPAPGDRGTEVHVELRYKPPAGPLGAAIAKLFGKEPGQQILSDLRRLKQVLETGEVMHSDASIAAGPHPAQPGARKGAPS